MTVLGNASEDELRRTMTSIYRFRAAFATLFPNARTTAPVPTSVVMFKDFGSFSRFQPRDGDGKRQQNVGGYMNFVPDRNFIAFGAGASEDSHIIFHEYA